MLVTEFVLSQLPDRARVLEVGCGAGELALTIAAAGHDVVAIDPNAPVGSIFRQVSVEEFDEDAPFDAAVAVRSLHHMESLRANLEKIARFAPRLIVEEFAWDRMDEETLDWYFGQLRILDAAGAAKPGTPKTLDELRQWWVEHHETVHGVHRYAKLDAELRRAFHAEHFEWVPYLWHYLSGPQIEALERGLINAGAIRPLGFRFVGVRR